MKGFIRASFPSAVYFVSMAFLASPSVAIGGLAALIVHESGHLIAALCLREPIASIEFSPIGGVIRTKEGHSADGVRGALLAVSGPMANVFAVLVCIKLKLTAQQTAQLSPFVVTNCVMAALNLLPALPLDGSTIALSIGAYWFSVGSLIRMLTYIGCATGILLATIGIAGAVRFGILNISLPIIGVYIAAKAITCGKQMLCDKYYTVISELCFSDDKKTRPMNLIYARSDLPLVSLVPCLSSNRRTGFVFETKSGCVILSDAVICDALLRLDSDATIHDVVPLRNLS